MQFLPDQVHAEFFRHYFSMFEFHIVDEDNAIIIARYPLIHPGPSNSCSIASKTTASGVFVPLLLNPYSDSLLCRVRIEIVIDR